MREAELNRQRVVFTPQEAARLPQDRPYAAYICHYDWAEGEHATLMHCHERLAEVLAVLRAHRLEPKRLAFVKNKPSAAPWLFLVEAQKNRRTGLRIEPDVLITAGAAMYGEVK